MEKKIEEMQQGVVTMAVEAYRLNAFVKSLVPRIADERLLTRLTNQIARFDKMFAEGLNTAGLEWIDLTGNEYDPGLPIEPINMEEFTENDELIIEVMLEPVVKIKDSTEIIKKGIVVLGGKEK